MTRIATRSRHMLAGPLAVLAALATAGAAQAGPITVNGPNQETYSITLKIAGLDLTSAEARTRLGNRINMASRHVCGIGHGSALDNTEGAKSCLANARADAWSQVEARSASGSKADLVVAAH